MTLENEYYKITGMEADGRGGVFHIALLPDCDVYRGHFPDNPVSPGACNIQVVKECAERLTGRQLRLVTIRRCRLTAVVTPADSPELDIKINLTPTDDGYDIVSSMYDTGRTYMELRGGLRG